MLQTKNLYTNTYIYIKNINTRIITVITGPQKYTLKNDEIEFGKVERYVVIPKNHYCILENPILINKNEIVMNNNGMPKLQYGKRVILFHQEPFALYPGEKLIQEVTPMHYIKRNTILRLKVLMEYVDGDKLMKPGNEFYLSGPQLYVPKIELKFVEILKCITIKNAGAGHFKALNDVDDDGFGKSRIKGEEWMILGPNKFYPHRDILYLYTTTPIEIFRNNHFLFIQCTSNFEDMFGIARVAGDQWVVSSEDTLLYYKSNNETILETVNPKYLDIDQYLNVTIMEKNKDAEFSKPKLERIIGPCYYHWSIGSTVGPQEKMVLLKRYEAVKVIASKDIIDEDKVERKAGEKWLVKGPRLYMPPLYVKVVDKCETHVLSVDKGIYVKNCDTGLVKLVSNQCYMLKENEELWTKLISSKIDKKLSNLKRTTENVLEKLRRFETEEIDSMEANELLKTKKKKSRIISQKLLLKKFKKITNVTNMKQSNTETPQIPLPSIFTTNKSINGNGVDQKDRVTFGQRAIRENPTPGPPKTSSFGSTFNSAGFSNDPPKRNAGRTKTLMDLDALDIGSQKDFIDSVNDVEMECPNEFILKKSFSKQHEMITYQVLQGHVVQIFEKTSAKSRIVFGPNLVKLCPQEEFTLICLSGGIPKVVKKNFYISLKLGPDFFRDKIIVETSDHARLAVSTAYKWHFQVTRNSPESEIKKLFAVPDFIGDSCNKLASLIRSAIASIKFEDFHKNSINIIKNSVFGVDKNGIKNKTLFFGKNNLVITGVDVRSILPVEEHTKEALQKSIQLAIAISTKSQEENAKHAAELVEEESNVKLEMEKIDSLIELEKQNKLLAEVIAETMVVQKTGEKKKKILAQIEGERIAHKSNYQCAKMSVEADELLHKYETKKVSIENDLECQHIRKVKENEFKEFHEKLLLETEGMISVLNKVGPTVICEIANVALNEKKKKIAAMGLQTLTITNQTVKDCYHD